MKKMYCRSIALGVMACCFTLPSVASAAPRLEVLRGWLSDEQCARGRAHDGVFTATNPDCAKRCVKEGKKIVLIDPHAKRVLTLTNPEIAKDNVGDLVEIKGELDAQAMTLHVASLKFLEKGVTMCGLPPKKSSTK